MICPNCGHEFEPDDHDDDCECETCCEQRRERARGWAVDHEIDLAKEGT